MMRRRQPAIFVFVLLTALAMASVSWACPAVSVINKAHEAGKNSILAQIANDFHGHRDWLTGDFQKQTIIPALKNMTEKLSVKAMDQAGDIGRLFDAKQELETLRRFEALKVRAYADYQPSESFCAIGTGVRSLSESEQLSTGNKLTLAEIALKRQNGVTGTAASEGQGQDLFARWNKFASTTCNIDEGFDGSGASSLVSVCQGVSQQERVNSDIDYQRLVADPHTVDVNFMDNNVTDTERDYLSLSNNLYAHYVPSRSLLMGEQSEGALELYLRMRGVNAMRSVAQESFNAQLALKASGHSGSAGYMAKLLQDLGMSKGEIESFLTENPSYYAQLEVLSKRIFQSPDFYVGLVDKPVNTKRKKAALNAIELLLDRAIYESEMRQEMILSILLSSKTQGDLVVAASPLE